LDPRVEKAPWRGTSYFVSFIQYQVNYIYRIRLRWLGHVARMEEGRSPFKILRDNPTRSRDGVDGRTILEWSLTK
jgi:hypothetical protein